MNTLILQKSHNLKTESDSVKTHENTTSTAETCDTDENRLPTWDNYQTTKL